MNASPSSILTRVASLRLKGHGITAIFLVLVALVVFIWNYDPPEGTRQSENTCLRVRPPQQRWRRLRHKIDEIFYCWMIFASILSPVLLLEPANFWTEKAFWKIRGE